MSSPRAWLTTPKLVSSLALQHTTEIIVLEKGYFSDISKVSVHDHDRLVGLGAPGHVTGQHIVLGSELRIQKTHLINKMREEKNILRSHPLEDTPPTT